jgi:photosystem I subunit 8
VGLKPQIKTYLDKQTLEQEPLDKKPLNLRPLDLRSLWSQVKFPAFIFAKFSQGVFAFQIFENVKQMISLNLPSILVPLVGLVFPAVVMASLFLYIEKEQLS